MGLLSPDLKFARVAITKGGNTIAEMIASSVSAVILFVLLTTNVGELNKYDMYTVGPPKKDLFQTGDELLACKQDEVFLLRQHDEVCSERGLRKS